MKIVTLDDAVKSMEQQIQGAKELGQSGKKCSWSKMEGVLLPVNASELILKVVKEYLAAK